MKTVTAACCLIPMNSSCTKMSCLGYSQSIAASPHEAASVASVASDARSQRRSLAVVDPATLLPQQSWLLQTLRAEAARLREKVGALEEKLGGAAAEE